MRTLASLVSAVVAVCGMVWVPVSARQHHVGLGANFVLPSFLLAPHHGHHDLEKGNVDADAADLAAFLTVDCDDGRKIAALGVDKNDFAKFAQLHQQDKCRCVDPACTVEQRPLDWTPQSRDMLQRLWDDGRLLRPINQPGLPVRLLFAFPASNTSTATHPSPQMTGEGADHDTLPFMSQQGRDLEAVRSGMEEQLVSASHGLTQVMTTVIDDGDGESTVALMKQALGHDVFALTHPTRKAAQTVLDRIKHNFLFFHGNECPEASHNNVECGSSQHIGSASCNSEESPHMCSYVELYSCAKCDLRFRFPRYRSVPKLLETKKGRCGEFSDVALAAFTMLGYDARQVVDYTDHVWVELALPPADANPHSASVTEAKGKEYVHADPSEGVLDNPLMYVDGWKKQLTFVFAHKSHIVQDRIHAYTHDEQYSEVVDRRGMEDSELHSSIADANAKLQDELVQEHAHGLEEVEVALPETAAASIEALTLKYVRHPTIPATTTTATAATKDMLGRRDLVISSLQPTNAQE